MEKHEDTCAWELWLESDEGRACTSGGAVGDSLKGRLQRAFLAGKKWHV